MVLPTQRASPQSRRARCRISSGVFACVPGRRGNIGSVDCGHLCMCARESAGSHRASKL